MITDLANPGVPGLIQVIRLIQVTGPKLQFTAYKISLRDMIDSGTRDTDDSVVSLVVQMFFCSTRLNNASETHLPLVHWSLIAGCDVWYTKDGTGCTVPIIMLLSMTLWS